VAYNPVGRGRLEAALSGRTYADLDQIVADLPATQASGVTPVAKTNGLAMASLASGIAQFGFGPVATIPAIVFGHVALHQIRRTGEQGTGVGAELPVDRARIVLQRGQSLLQLRDGRPAQGRAAGPAGNVAS
jgi:Domain of unknown function (DUF4190)